MYYVIYYSLPDDSIDKEIIEKHKTIILTVISRAEEVAGVLLDQTGVIQVNINNL